MRDTDQVGPKGENQMPDREYTEKRTSRRQREEVSERRSGRMRLTDSERMPERPFSQNQKDRTPERRSSGSQSARASECRSSDKQTARPAERRASENQTANVLERPFSENQKVRTPERRSSGSQSARTPERRASENQAVRISERQKENRQPKKEQVPERKEKASERSQLKTQAAKEQGGRLRAPEDNERGGKLKTSAAIEQGGQLKTSAAKERGGQLRASAAKERGGRLRASAAQERNGQPRERVDRAGEAKNSRDSVREGKGEQGGPTLQERLATRKRRKLRRIFCCFGGVLAVIYIAVAVYFGSHFYEGTEIYGIDCSQKTADEVKAEVADKLDDYRLELLERGGKSEFITAGQISLEFVDNSSVDRMMKAQRSYIWPIMLMMERSTMASVAFTYDQAQAVSAFKALDCMNPALVTAPRDAYIKTTDTGFEVESEVMGTTLDEELAQEAYLSALNGGKSLLDLEDCYVNPAIYQTDEGLQSDAAAMSELARAQITYDFGTEKEVVNAPVIQDWIVKLANGSFVIDDVCVTNYVEELAAKYDTFGLTREFYTSIGTTVTLTGGDYGWCIDQDATVVALLNALQEGYKGTMEPVYLYTAKSRENGDIGYTYVEVCISLQEMWCYQDGVCIVDTPVVTGNPNKGNATPSGGVWAIDAKKENAVLVGEGYQSPVDYWMPFNGDVGIHDMQARAYFGGSIYLSNGSHGCVNTPYEQAKTIFNTVEVGTPVIVYD